MTRLTLSHTIDCNADTFWKVFLDPTFQEKLYREELGYLEFTLGDRQETATEIRQLWRERPNVHRLPSAVSQVLTANFFYAGEGVFNKTTQVWTFALHASSFESRLTNQGILRVEAVGERQVQRIAKLDLAANIFGLGELLERVLAKKYQEAYDRSAVFMNNWLISTSPNPV